MDDLKDLILTLELNEIREFRSFLQRQKFIGERKDLRLFEILLTHDNVGEELISQDLKLKNRNAYHSLRKRLYAELSEFIMVKSIDEDDSKSARASGYYNLAKHLFQRQLHALAWKFLIKAEKLALQNDLFEILHLIYLFQIAHVHEKDGLKLSDLIIALDLNNEKLRISEKVALAKAHVLNELKSSKTKGVPVNLVPILEKSIESYNLNEVLQNSPKILLDYLESLKNTVHISKSYHSLESVIENYYVQLKVKSNELVNVQIVYMLAHTKYRNKKFAASLELLSDLDNRLEKISKSFRQKLYPKMEGLLSANLVMIGKLNEAIERLVSLNEQRLGAVQKSLVVMNLGIYHFFNGEPKKSLEWLQELNRSEKWYVQSFGQEWLFKKKLMEILLFYELESYELVASKIRSLERRFKEFLKLETYARARVFLSLIKSFMLSKKSEDLEKFSERVSNSWEWKPAEEEDLQAMMFYAWLMSKLNQRPFYKTILGIVDLEY